MVGNDIVDMVEFSAEPADARSRFDRRVCRTAERESIQRAPDPSRERWCHWAAKEAAYKLVKKQDAQAIFSPIRFEVHLGSEPKSWQIEAIPSATRHGFIEYGSWQVDLQLTLLPNLAVHAIARTSERNDQPLVTGALAIGDSCEAEPSPAQLSEAVRTLACGRLAEVLAVEPEALSIGKRGRVPELRYCDRRFGADLSLSHHGRMVAFACVLPGQRLQERLAS